ncbi:hypothetical protein F4780DRAFT_603716 [Xylariomycetidae sp. FL0641]|nr:hypothetical protein F4780DRAFT_603716 [Xylariomycetidae sp. FL0641]
MDDPWGSPWASDVATKHEHIHQPSPPKSLLSPPPRALLGTAHQSPGHSPWADDNDFGGWQATDKIETLGAGSVWANNAELSPQLPQSSSKAPSSGKASPRAWPSSAATSPGLRPLPRSRASSIFRHHSPDPWAAELSLNDRPASLSPASLRPTASPGTSPIPTPLRETIEGSPFAPEADTSKDIAATKSPESTHDQDGEEKQEDREQAASAGVLDGPESRNAGTERKPIADTQEAQSRPSSTFSADSRNPPERPDSPITSIDEEPKHRARKLNRKPSRVQELVGMYDDLTKTKAKELLAPEPHEGPRLRGQENSVNAAVSHGGTGFGGFAEAKTTHSREVSAVKDLILSPLPSASLAPSDAGTPRSSHPAADGFRNNPGGEPTSGLYGRLVEKYGPVSFDIDQEALDGLFPGTDDLTAENVDNNNVVPKKIISDSFTSISERKAWYRISRFGSMRKHDSGEEDNYHRVSWRTCQLHGETIKIVRRWMEEDSFSGRAAIGGSKRTSFFNWDSSPATAPVDLEKVFGRKPSVRKLSVRKPSIGHTRTTSIPPPSQKALGNIADAQPSRNSIGASPPGAAPTASFGWTSDEVKTSIASMQQSLNARPLKPPPPAPLDLSSMPNGGGMTAEEEEEDDDDDDDDDWGEMVSSPKPDAQSHVATEASIAAITEALPQPHSTAPKLSLAIPNSNHELGKSKDAMSSESKRSRTDPWPLADFSIFEKATRTPSRTPKSGRSPKSSTRQDPWPLADFSVFESPISRSRPELPPALRDRTLAPPRSPLVPPKSPLIHDSSRQSGESLNSTASSLPPKPLKAVLGPIEKSNGGLDADAIVRDIVLNLPDLSYMLR